MREYSEVMIETADEINVPCYDLNYRSADEVANEVSDYMDRYMYSVNGSDGSHLTAYGADLYAGYIVDYLKSVRHLLSDVFTDNTDLD